MTREQKTRRVALSLAAVVAAIWVGLYWLGHRPQQDAMPYTFTSMVFGEPVHIPVTVTAFYPLSASNDVLDQRINEIFERIPALMSTKVADSEVSRFNASTSTELFRLSPETAEVLACALAVGDQTAGAFDVTTGTIARAQHAAIINNATLSDEELNELRTHTGLDKLEFDPQTATIRKIDPAVTIDLDALLPGYSLDLVVRLLEDSDAKQYRASMGTTLHHIIRHPDEAGHPITTDIAEMTSPNTDPVMDAYAIIDARTGTPPGHTLNNILVRHKSALWAGAYARAIWVLGTDDGLLLARLLKLPVLIREEYGKQHTSEAYKEWLDTRAPR